MKLCIVTHTVMKGDGQGRVNYEVAREAIRRGHHVTLLASSVDLALQQHSQVDWIPIPVKGYPLQLVREIAALPYLVCQIISFLMPYTLAGWDFKALAPLPQVAIREAKSINELKALPSKALRINLS